MLHYARLVASEVVNKYVVNDGSVDRHRRQTRRCQQPTSTNKYALIGGIAFTYGTPLAPVGKLDD